MFNQKSILLVFIDRLGIQLYGGNLQSIISVQIPDSIIHDLEIVSRDSLYSLIKQWVKQYSIVGSQIVFIFSESMYVDKIFVISQQSQIETDILKYFELVPYESIWSKVFPAKNGKRAVAFNKALYEGIHQGFLLQGLPTKCVIPAFALGEFETQHTLDLKMASYVLENLVELSKLSLIDGQDSSIVYSSPPSAGATETDKKKSSLPMLLSIFGVLLLVLGVVAYIQFR